MPRKQKQSAEAAINDIRRRTRRKFSAEEKVRIVLEGLRGEQGVAELCRREGIAANLYYRWSKDFLEAGKKRLSEPGRQRRLPNSTLFRQPVRAHRRRSHHLPDHRYLEFLAMLHGLLGLLAPSLSTQLRRQLR